MTFTGKAVENHADEKNRNGEDSNGIAASIANEEETDTNDIDMDDEAVATPEMIGNYTQLLRELSYDAQIPAFHAKTRWDQMLDVADFVADARYDIII